MSNVRHLRPAATCAFQRGDQCTYQRMLFVVVYAKGDYRELDAVSAEFGPMVLVRREREAGGV